jgi:hypothetical protein
MIDTKKYGIYIEKSNEVITHYNDLVSDVRKHIFTLGFRLMVTAYSINQSDILQSSDTYTVKQFQKIITPWRIPLVISILFSILTFGLIQLLPSLVSKNFLIPHNFFPLTELLLVFIFAGIYAIPIVKTIKYLIDPKKEVLYGFKFGFLLCFAVVSCFMYLLLITIQKMESLKSIIVLLSIVKANLIFFYILWLPGIILLTFIVLVLGESLLKSPSLVLLYFSSRRSTIMANYVRQLIFATRGTARWNLISLSSSEIVTIKNRARNNLEITEKTTIPLAVITALGSFLLGIPYLQKVVDDGVTFLGQLNAEMVANYSIATSFLIFFIPLVVFIAWGILIIEIIGLFLNIFVQGILIEACVIAEYAKLELEQEISRQKQTRSLWQTIIDWFCLK